LVDGIVNSRQELLEKRQEMIEHQKEILEQILMRAPYKEPFRHEINIKSEDSATLDTNNQSGTVNMVP
jgi:hypothetical protein